MTEDQVGSVPVGSYMTEETAKRLREPFPDSAIGQLPARKGSSFRASFVGHAAVVDRLCAVDPSWTWEPMAYDEEGLPRVRYVPSGQAELWIWLTVCGVRRMEVGMEDVELRLKGGDAVPVTDLSKKLLSDALRRGAMRFGVAVDLWSKEELTERPEPEPQVPWHEASGWDSEEQAAEERERVWKAVKGLSDTSRLMFKRWALMEDVKLMTGKPDSASPVRRLLTFDEVASIDAKVAELAEASAAEAAGEEPFEVDEPAAASEGPASLLDDDAFERVES